MTIMRGDKDVVQEILSHAEAHAEALRTSPHGRRQRDVLFAALTTALHAIDGIQRPWLDDCIAETRSRVLELRRAIPRE